MSLIQQTVSGLHNGVSQQPPTMRLDNQCERQENALATLVHGLFKRPPSYYMFELPVTTDEDYFVHKIQRDVNEWYFVLFTNDLLEPIIVYDILNQTQKSVDYGHLDEDLNFTPDVAVREYLTSNPDNLSPKQRMRAVSIADYTVITNKSVTPQLDMSQSSPVEPTDAYIVVEGIYSDNLTVELNGAEVTEPNVDNTTLYDVVAGKIKARLEALDGEIYVDQEGAVLWVYYADNRDFSLTISEPHVKIYKKAVTSYSDLWSAKKFQTHKPRIRLLQNEYGDGINYYVKSNGDNWIEDTGFNLNNHFDPTTMPHRLVRMPDGSFVCATIDWEPRKVGDEKSAPTPSFINEKIENVFFHQNRLGLMTKTTVVFSKAGDYFNWFPGTALEVLADDPIDIGIATTEVVSLREAIPFNKNLLLRADNNQFILSYSGSGLEPTTVSIDQTTQYQTVSYSFSSSAGSNLYFACPQQNNIAVREYYVQPDSLVEDAADITIAIPNYIPLGDEVVLEAIPEHDIMLCFSSGDPQALYVYKYYWQGKEKPQSAWCRWDFQNPIKGVAAFGANFFVVLEINSRSHAFFLPLNTEPSELVYVDKQQNLAGAYDGGMNETYFELGYPDDATNYVVIDPDSNLQVTEAYKVAGESKVRVPGDISGKVYTVGQTYTMEYEFNKWFLKDQNGQVRNGRLQLRSLSLVFQDTGYFTLEVQPKYRDPLIHTFTGLILDQSTLDTGNVHTGDYRFMAPGKADETSLTLKSDSHLPCTIQGVTYEGFFHSRSRMF